MTGWLLVIAMYLPGNQVPISLHTLYDLKTKAVCERNAKIIIGEFDRSHRTGERMRSVCVPAYEGTANANP